MIIIIINNKLKMNTQILNMCTISTFLVILSLSSVYCTVDNSPYNSPFTREEKVALEQFRSLMKDHLYKEHMKTDEYLIRWLRAKKLNVNDAAQMLARSLEWRRINRIDDIQTEDFTNFKKMFPFTVDGKDRKGRPVGVCLTGKQDVRKALLAGEREQFLRYYAYQIEMLDRVIRTYSNSSEFRNITTCTLILDLNGFNLRQHVCVACLPIYFDFVSIYENHYPNMLHAFYILNAPGIFEPIKDFIRPFLSGTTRSILRIYGYNRDEWKTSLLNEIAPDQLPVTLGGTRNI